MIKRDTIEQVRAASDIVEVVGRYLPLKKVGKYFRAVCPFHPDKSPSFYVSPDRQVYHCFGCGAGGSAITFVMQYEKLSFPEAVKALADKHGIKVQLERVNVRHQPLYDACEFAAQFFSQQLAKYSVAVNYLLKRGMKDETVARFRLGYAPGGNLLRHAAQKAGIKDDVLLKAGLIRTRDPGPGTRDQGPDPRTPSPEPQFSDWFFGRVVCPITSLSGRVVGFSGRVLDDSEPKYMNSTETDIFRKGENLFGLFQAKNYLRTEVPLLVEGNFDLLALANRSINNVVAPLGTAFTYEQALLLKRFNPQVRVLFDADLAGRTAARRALEVLLRAGLEPSLVLLPEGLDPDEFIRKAGKDALLEHISQAADPVEFLRRIRRLQTVAEKNAALRETLQLVALVPDPVLRELYLNRLAEAFQVAKDVLRARLPQVRDQGPGTRASGADPRPRTPGPGPRAFGLPEKLLALAAQNPEYTAIAREVLPPETFDEPFLRETATKLYALAQEQPVSLARLVDALNQGSESPSQGGEPLGQGGEPLSQGGEPLSQGGEPQPETTARRVAAWEFLIDRAPSSDEFARLAYSLRSKHLWRRIREAEDKDDDATAARLRQEHYELRKKLLQKAPKGQIIDNRQ